MKKIKGCLQDNCIALKKKIVYKVDDNFCTKCGKSLYIVCKRCKKTVIEEGSSSVLCIRCQAEVDDKRQKKIDATKKAVVGVVAGAGAMVGVVDKIPFKKK